jgi:hypothetical protein
MSAIVYSTSPSRVSASQNQYGSYGSVNKSILRETHQQQQQQHHHVMHSGPAPAPPLSIYQVKEHHNNYLMSRNYNYKRNKSAVEMLAESKPYYVKSETVLDRHQQLNSRGNNTLSCK